MPINARFQADFSSFHTAVRQAEVQLADFTKGAAGVEKQLARMTEGFSGRKLIQDAALMTKAVDDIGGVSKLTDAELRKISGTANDAVDKMKRLGIEVPPGLLKIVDASKQVDSSTKGSGRSISALSNYVKELVPAGDSAHSTFSNLHRTLTGMWDNPTAGVKQLAAAAAMDLGPALGTLGVVGGAAAAGMTVAAAAASSWRAKRRGSVPSSTT